MWAWIWEMYPLFYHQPCSPYSHGGCEILHQLGFQPSVWWCRTSSMPRYNLDNPKKMGKRMEPAKENVWKHLIWILWYDFQYHENRKKNIRHQQSARCDMDWFEGSNLTASTSNISRPKKVDVCTRPPTGYDVAPEWYSGFFNPIDDRYPYNGHHP